MPSGQESLPPHRIVVVQHSFQLRVRSLDNEKALHVFHWDTFKKINRIQLSTWELSKKDFLLFFPNQQRILTSSPDWSKILTRPASFSWRTCCRYSRLEKNNIYNPAQRYMYHQTPQVQLWTLTSAPFFLHAKNLYGSTQMSRNDLQQFFYLMKKVPNGSFISKSFCVALILVNHSVCCSLAKWR
jgi:hypothetical protein